MRCLPQEAYFRCLAALQDLTRPTSLQLDLHDGMLVLDISGDAAPAWQHRHHLPAEANTVWLSEVRRRGRAPDAQHKCLLVSSRRMCAICDWQTKPRAIGRLKALRLVE
jgi:hypothetical protein